MVYQKENRWCRCVNGEGLALFFILESWGKLSEELTTTPLLFLLYYPWQQICKESIPYGSPTATFLKSWLELMMWEILVAESCHEIHTRNSVEAERKADGRATIAPHEQMQFISVSFPCFNAPHVVGCCLATLPLCSTDALWFCCSSWSPPLH